MDKLTLISIGGIFLCLSQLTFIFALYYSSKRVNTLGRIAMKLEDELRKTGVING